MQRFTMPGKKHTSSFLHIVGAIGVFCFTASCTVDLFRKITPESTPWLPYLAVAILEYGLFSWGHAYLYKFEKDTKKNNIALAMACFSGFCVAVITTVELASIVQAKGMAQVPVELLGYAVWVPVCAIGLNVLAYLGCVVWANEAPASLAPQVPMQYVPPATNHPGMPGYYMIQSQDQQGGYLQPPFTMLPLPAQQYHQQQMNQSRLNSQPLQSQGERQASGVQNQEKQES